MRDRTANPSAPIAELRRRLAARSGRELWRSLDEIADTPEFQTFLQNEFPHRLPSGADGVNRREFMKVMAASVALAGFGACTRQPPERIVPYVRQPEHSVLGEPLQFATAMPGAAGYGIGVLARSHDGRPTKIEGNPDHPASLGASDAIMQASVLGLYDPDRSQVVTSAGSIRTWDAFRTTLREALAVQRARRGSGLRILTETITSPTLAGTLERLLETFPEARWHQWDALGRDSMRAGSRLAFGRNVETHYRLERADVVVALDADLFTQGPAHLRYTRDFMSRRRPTASHPAMNRLYAIESMPSVTGGAADHRLPVRSADVERVARALARALGVELGDSEVDLEPALRSTVEALARDLSRHRGACAIVPGEHQSPLVHALAHSMNHTLQNVGRTVVNTEPIEARPADHEESLRSLSNDMHEDAVELLLILSANPAYTAPPDLKFGVRLRKVPLRIHLGPQEDETAALCHWHVPEAHYLESWSDVRAYDGTASIIQPLIAPLYEAKTAAELLSTCLDDAERPAHDLVRAHWRSRYQGSDFEVFWREALHDGLVPSSSAPPVNVVPRKGWMRGAAPAEKSRGLEIVLRPAPYALDGRYVNNGWLQELPQPITQLTWDNAALVAPATAETLGVDNGDVVRLEVGERSVEAPVWIVPGHAAGSVTAHLGYGRWRAGRVGSHVGFNAYLLSSSRAAPFENGLDLTRTGRRHTLATTQQHHSMEGRHLVRTATLEEYRAHPDFAQHVSHEPRADMTLYPPHPYEGHAWGMTIDLASCIGCNACTAACQAENNIPVVGKTEVLRGREMHWIRVDRYYSRDLDAPDVHLQPVACMHCENAPCELVCPVNATVHSSEGLNEMVYNRCVGTRYCSNNCPYKVRRFNFFLYNDWNEKTLQMVRNPDVTVRSRGVMEKCTYCVQRIERSRIGASKEGRPLRDGEIVTACQQACPAQAIVFGDVNDPESRVAKLKADPRSYGLLTDRNTRPRTTYLAAVKNPNPEIAGPGSGKHS